MHDAIVISDVHLGSENCQAKQLGSFLEAIHDGELLTRCLILNGDVFDSIDFRRLKKHHWRILSLIRKLSDQIEILWINGNHDGSSEVVSHLLGVTCEDEAVIVSGGRRILLLHGHVFDEFIDAHPILTWIADTVYHWLQRIDTSHHFAKLAKRKSKVFLRSTRKIQAKSIEHARRLGCQAVCCGHTHLPVALAEGPVAYYNSGCWTEKPCHYLTIGDGVVRLHAYSPDETETVLADSLPSAAGQEVLLST